MADNGTGYMTYDSDALDSLIKNKKAVSVGMGWGSAKAYSHILAHLLSRFEGTLIIDADGLNTLATMDRVLLKNAICRVVLTPHLKEFERLSGIPITETVKDPVAFAERFAKENGVCLLLKGCTTVVTDGKETYLCDRGSAGMATAGSGDVLSGILTGLLGYLPASPLTVACGAYLAGRAGELAEGTVGAISMIASDTVNALPKALSKILLETEKT
jgi:NAD(P)H-hydrate epimerase